MPITLFNINTCIVLFYVLYLISFITSKNLPWQSNKLILIVFCWCQSWLMSSSSCSSASFPRNVPAKVPDFSYFLAVHWPDWDPLLLENIDREDLVESGAFFLGVGGEGVFIFGFLKPNSSVIRPRCSVPCVAADCASLALRETPHCAQLNQPHDVQWMSHGRPHVTFPSSSSSPA